MYDILVLAQGMYDQSLNLPESSMSRTRAALAWIQKMGITNQSVLYFAAYKPPVYPTSAPALSSVMKEAIKDIYSGSVIALEEPCNFTTKGEITKFLQVSNNQPVIISGRYHLIRIFLYLWEAKGWQYARSAQYVAVLRDKIGLRQWLIELIKMAVILLPETIQNKIEVWYAQKTHKLVR
jgi:hypothetical protein